MMDLFTPQGRRDIAMFGLILDVVFLVFFAFLGVEVWVLGVFVFAGIVNWIGFRSNQAIIDEEGGGGKDPPA